MQLMDSLAYKIKRAELAGDHHTRCCDSAVQYARDCAALDELYKAHRRLPALMCKFIELRKRYPTGHILDTIEESDRAAAVELCKLDTGFTFDAQRMAICVAK